MGNLVHPTTVRNGIADYVVDLVDAGAGAGFIAFFTSAYTADLAAALGTAAELARLTMSDPAFAAAGSGQSAANSITADTDVAAGTVASFGVFDSNNNLVFKGDVTSDDVGTGSIQLSSVDLGSGDTLSLSSLTYTAPA
jgi:hypothetical protein